MNISSILETGGVLVPNPNYSKSKKNKEPEFIVMSDLESGIKPTGSLLGDIAYEAAEKGQQDILGRDDELNKYIEYGITPNDFENLDRLLIDKQGAFTKLGNGIAQAIVSEAAIGTVKAFPDLIDLIGQITNLSDDDYNNPVSSFLEEKQEEFRNFAPVYSDETIHIDNGGLLDAGWWGHNIPSIMSSLTLLIPSAGVVKTASYLGKTLNVGSYSRQAIRALSGTQQRLNKAIALKRAGASIETIEEARKLNKVQKFLTSNSTAKQTALFLENGTTAALSRALENYQESRQVYNNMYADASEWFEDDNNFNNFIQANEEQLKQAGIDINNKDEVAKYVATSSADRTFQLDWSNVVFDVLQIYGLRNAWKGLKNAYSNPASVRRANIDAAKYFGKTPEEIAAIKAGRKFGEKAKEWAEDKLYGSKLILGAQLSEGVEEAINYIAQEEGIHFGNVMLGKEIGTNKGIWENIFNGFDNRLVQYASAPDLWDSAFWGVLGGVTFQLGGSYLQRISNKIKDSNSKASKKAKENLPWYAIDELPEDKRRISEIQARNQDFNEYKANLDRINNGEDIYNSTPENPVKFSSDEIGKIEQQNARDKLKDEYIAKMTLRAMYTGNYDLLRAYLSDENIRKGLIESGIFGTPNENKSRAEIEQEAKQYIEDSLRRMERIERMYDEEILAIDHASSMIGTEKDEKGGKRNPILAEYMQIIAFNNVKGRIDIGNKRNILNEIDERITEVKAQFNDVLDPNINYENNIRIGILANLLGQFRSQRKRLLNDDNSLSNQISIKEIDKRISSIEEDLTDAELMYATVQSLRYIMNDDGTFSQKDTEEYFQYVDFLITRRGEFTIGSKVFNDNNLLNSLSNRARTIVDDNIFGEFKVLKQDADITFGKLRTISPELDELYQRKAIVTKSIDFANNDISRTVDEVRNATGILHNTMDEARKNAINDANNIITNLYFKYGNQIRTAIKDRYYSNKENNIKNSNLSDIEKQQLSYALDVLDITKSYNQSLIDILEDQFSLIDMVNAAKEQQEVIDSETDEKNITNLNDNTASNNSELNDNTASNNSELNDNTETQLDNNTGQQTDQNNDILDPQQIENRIPSFYGQFYLTKKGKFISNGHSNKDNGGSAIYDNHDGTFTIDVRGNIKSLNNERLFYNTKQVDLTRPYEIVTKPIARRNKRGNLEIIQTGELRNTDTLEYQEEQERQKDVVNNEQTIPENDTNESIEENVRQIANDLKPIIDAKKEKPIDADPSTGELNKQKSNYEEVETLEYTPSQSDEISNKALGILQSSYKANHDVDLDAIASQIIEENVQNGNDRAITEAAVNKSLALIKRVIERRTANKAITMKSSIDEVVVEQINPLTKAYQDAVKEMVKQYAKEFGLQKHNGKYYVNLEDLLRFVNTISNDSSIATNIFESLKSYLKTDDAKSDFIVMDEEDVDKTNFIDNVNKSASERYLERLNINNSQRVNIDAIVNNLSSQEDIDNFYNVIDSLNIGDKLTYIVSEGKIIIKTSDGKSVGTMPLPKINSSTGAYIMVNDGWIYDILSTNNGEVISKLKDTFTRWFDVENADTKELNDILYEFVYDKPNDTRKKELIEKFKNNNEIKLAKLNGVISYNASYEQLINGLYKLWKFKDYASTDVNNQQNINIVLSLERWFKDVLLQSYDGVMTLANNLNTDIEVAEINQGELIRITDTSDIESFLPASEALAGGVNPNIHKIAVGQKGCLITSGMPNLPFSGVSSNSVRVVISNRSGNHGYVHARVVDVTESTLGNDAKDIMSAIHTKIINLLNEYNNDPNEDNFNNIKEFIMGLVFSRNNNPNSMFYGIVASDNGNNISITNPNTGRKFVIKKGSNVAIVSNPEFPAVTINGKSYNQKNIPLDNSESYRHIKEIINSLRFNINQHLVSSDNDTKLTLNGILSRTKDGKFKITIGEKTWIYDTFNEFVLKNNLVNLNTKPNESGTSNYTRKGIRSQKGNTTLRIKINSPLQSPVEDKQPTQPAQSDAARANNIPINTQIESILSPNFNSNNKGLDIAKLVFSEEQLKVFEVLGILPENIKFDAEFNNKKGNENYNAEVNPKTGEVIVGTKWLNLFKNPNTRKEAIRKLIHEQLHIKLFNKKGYVASAQEIYNEFKNYLDKNKVPDNAHIRAYLFSNYSQQDAIEEFLIESLTSKELADYLNQIDASVTEKHGKRNLFQKILEFLSKIFDWGVRKNSLYEKELYTLRDAFSKPNRNNKSVKTAEIQLKSDFNQNEEFNEKPDDSPILDNYVTTAEFERLQKESLELSEIEIRSYHTGYISDNNNNEKLIQLFTDEDRQRLGKIYEKLLSKRNNTKSDSSITLHAIKNGVTTNFEIVEANPNVFHDIFEINRKYLPNGELVDLHDNYDNCKCFISTDGLCGFAIEEDGNIISVFSLNPSTKRGFLYAIKDFIISNGGNHLDAYSSNKQNLENIYKKAFGFQTASSMDYNMEYDHDNIAERHGNPKVVFMVKSDKIVKTKSFDENSYDEAVSYQKQNIDNPILDKKVEIEDETNNPYGEDYVDDDLDSFYSSVTEENNSDYTDEMKKIKAKSIADVTEIASNIPSVQSMQERLPIEQQSKFASLVASATIQSSCK